MLTHLSLFSGIGGIDLAAEWAGFETIVFCEIDKYCQKVLRKHWPDVPIIEDVKDVTKEKIREIMDIANGSRCLYGQTEIQPAEAGEQAQRESESGSADRGGTGGERIAEIMADATGQRGGSKGRNAFYERWETRGIGQEGLSKNAKWENGFAIPDAESTSPICDTIRSGQSGEPRRRARSFIEDRYVGNPARNEVTLISGGFPCQPHSVAGKRKGAADERNLWPEFRRVIGEIRPRWVLGENVPGIFSSDSGRFFGEVVTDLAEMGYSVGWATYGAVDVGALHRRNRVFIVAFSGSQRCDNRSDNWGERHVLPDKGAAEESQPEGEERLSGLGEIGSTLADCPKQGLERTTGTKLQGSMFGLAPSGQDVADTDRQGLQGHGGLRECGEQWTAWQGGEPLEGIWESEPPVGRVASRISSRVDRLKCLGNAVVPQQVYPILKAIADIENSK